MAGFDWARFLSAHNIPFVTRGPNTARDHVSVKCPWCGEADPSQHMGISLKGNVWGCLRNERHRGRGAARLIQALLRCSSETARRIAGEEELSGPPSNEEFATRWRAMFGVEGSPTPTLTFPKEFKPLARWRASAEPFWDYLKERGYTEDGIEWLAKTYNLYYTRTGPYRYRIIIPVYDAHGVLMTWTARTISPNIELRYKTHPRELSVRDPKRLLLGLPLLWRAVNPDVLIIVEGPFDAFRVTALGHERGVYATCLFGLTVSPEQLELIVQLAGRFRRLVLLLDPDAKWTSLRLMDRLSGLGVRAGTLPDGVDDPGTLTPGAAEALMNSWLA